MLFPSRDQFWINNLGPQKHDTKAPALGGKFLRDHKYPFSSRTRLEAFGLFVHPILNQAEAGPPGSSNMSGSRFFLRCRCRPPVSGCTVLFVLLVQSADGLLSPGCEILLAWRRRRGLSSHLTLTNIPESHLSTLALWVVRREGR